MSIFLIESRFLLRPALYLCRQKVLDTMRRHIIIIFLSAISISGNALAQSDDVIHAFSPNAAEIGQYGKVPVDYYHGIPSVSIPLMEFHAVGYTLPVYLSYNSDGFNPDRHPGWVGLGWSFHAGGSITRVTHGLKDEADRNDYHYFSFNNGDNGNMEIKPGYMYYASEVQDSSLNVVDYLQNIYNWRNIPDATHLRRGDYAPDEFIVEMDGFHGSFFIAGDGSVEFQSLSDCVPEVTILYSTQPILHTLYTDLEGHDYNINIYSRITGFTVTMDDGTVYSFGGDDLSVEYEMTPRYDNHLSYSMYVEANVWRMTRIEYPNGEVVNFTYMKSGHPIVRSEYHWRMMSTNGVDMRNDDYTNDQEILTGQLRDSSSVAYTWLEPSYLQRIDAVKSGDRIVLYPSVSQEKRDTKINYALAQYRLNSSRPGYQIIQSNDYYLRLDSLRSNRGVGVRFHYGNSSVERLSLSSLEIKGIPNKANESMEYSMEYYPYPGGIEPDYGARRSDAWGYYNGISYGRHNYGMSNYSQMRNLRVPSLSHCQAGILHKLYYPTKGDTTFEYELNEYSRVFGGVEGLYAQPAGGLRIRTMTHNSGIGPSVTQSFSYILENNHSSGILTEEPVFYAGFEVAQYSIHKYLFSNLVSGVPVNPIYYEMGSDMVTGRMNQYEFSRVCYSRVVETGGDGGKTIYCFTDYTDYPDHLDITQQFSRIIDPMILNHRTSMSLARGLIESVEYQNSTGRRIRLITNEYQVDTLSSLNSFSTEYFPGSAWIRVCYNKIFTFFPKLKKKDCLQLS